MPKVTIKGKFSPEGKVLEGTGFKVKRLSRHGSKGWLRFKVTLENLSSLLFVESVKSTGKRRAESDGIKVDSKAKSTLEKTDPPKKSFVVVSGYTKPTGPKPGHHGISFVAVGESQGHG